MYLDRHIVYTTPVASLFPPFFVAPIDQAWKFIAFDSIDLFL